MATLAETAKRYRLNVPKEDVPVIQWLEAQVNPSVSIRTLIRDDIAKNGYTDATCREVNIRKGAGRPTYTEEQRAADEEIRKLEERKAELLKQKSKMGQTVPDTGYAPPVQTYQTPAANPTGSPADDLMGLL